MSLRSLVDWMKPRPSRAPARRTGRRPKACRPRLEALEDRWLPSFLAPVSYPVGANPQAMAVGDFTGTGIPDLVVANHDSGTVSVLLGKGDGTFQSAQNYAVGGHPSSVAVGDFNNDGKLDIVTANETFYANNTPAGGNISVLLGNGNGTFQPALNYAFAPSYAAIPQSVAVGDFNKDGKLDIAVTSYATISLGYGYTLYQQGLVDVLIGNGAGGFTADNSYALAASGWISYLYYSPGQFHSSVAVGDFMGNGNLDLAVAESDSWFDGYTSRSLSQVSVLLGNGDGTLRPPTNLAINASSLPDSVALGDFDGDKTLDIVTANQTGGVSVFLGKGDGTFGAPTNFSTSVNLGSVAVADFNRDGKLDILRSYGALLLGNGNGTFQTALAFSGGNGGVAVGDFNRDGWPDLAVAANSGFNTVSVLLNSADWHTLAVSGFPSSTTAGVPGSFTVTVKNSDGTTDTKYTGTVHFTSSDPKAVLPADHTFTATDGGVHTFSATLKTAGTQSITVTDTTMGLTGTDGGIPVNPAAASKFIISAPASITAGVRFSLTVTVEDAYDNVVTGYTGSIHFSSTDKKAGLPANYTFTAADKGKHTFTGLVLRTKGYQKITITDTLNSLLTACVIIDVL